jgi:hypothetical protein
MATEIAGVKGTVLKEKRGNVDGDNIASPGIAQNERSRLDKELEKKDDGCGYGMKNTKPGAE